MNAEPRKVNSLYEKSNLEASILQLQGLPLLAVSRHDSLTLLLLLAAKLVTVDESDLQICNCRRIWFLGLQLSTNLAPRPATVDESLPQACNCRRIWVPGLQLSTNLVSRPATVNESVTRLATVDESGPQACRGLNSRK